MASAGVSITPREAESGSSRGGAQTGRERAKAWARQGMFMSMGPWDNEGNWARLIWRWPTQGHPIGSSSQQASNSERGHSTEQEGKQIDRGAPSREMADV